MWLWASKTFGDVGDTMLCWDVCWCVKLFADHCSWLKEITTMDNNMNCDHWEYFEVRFSKKLLWIMLMIEVESYSRKIFKLEETTHLRYMTCDAVLACWCSSSCAVPLVVGVAAWLLQGNTIGTSLQLATSVLYHFLGSMVVQCILLVLKFFVFGPTSFCA